MKTRKCVFTLILLIFFIGRSSYALPQNATDWSVEMANWIVKSTPATQQPWNYTVGLVMEGLLRVYKRTADHRYLDYVNSWASSHISPNGTIDTGMVSLDNIMPGLPVLHLYSETHDERYRIAATTIRNSLKSWPRTSDKGLWHALDLRNELWLDGLYMGMPFLVTYGRMFSEEKVTYDEAILQFRMHIEHLKDLSTGLLVHAYDEDGSASWAVPPMNRSPWAWGRAIGWVTMGLSEILDVIPENYNNPDLRFITDEYKSLLKSLSKYQSSSTGLWYQVVDQPADTRNWQETSCTMLFIFSMSRAVEKGYLDDSYKTFVDKGYAGVLSQLSEDAGRNVSLRNICIGTGVSRDIIYYYNRRRVTNDNHGLGIFLIMNELLAYDNLPWLSLYTGTADNDNPDQPVSLFPNPCTNYTVLEAVTLRSDAEAELYDMTGAKVKQITVTPGRTWIDTSGLPRGLYFLKLRIEGKTIIKKLLRQ